MISASGELWYRWKIRSGQENELRDAASRDVMWGRKTRDSCLTEGVNLRFGRGRVDWLDPINCIFPDAGPWDDGSLLGSEVETDRARLIAEGRVANDLTSRLLYLYLAPRLPR